MEGTLSSDRTWLIRWQFYVFPFLSRISLIFLCIDDINCQIIVFLAQIVPLIVEFFYIKKTHSNQLFCRYRINIENNYFHNFRQLRSVIWRFDWNSMFHLKFCVKIAPFSFSYILSVQVGVVQTIRTDGYKTSYYDRHRPSACQQRTLMDGLGKLRLTEQYANQTTSWPVIAKLPLS